MVDLDHFIAIIKETGTSRFLVVIQFVNRNLPEMRLSPIVPVSNSTFAWSLLTITYTSSIISSVPLGETQLEKILMIELSSSYLVLNALLDTLLSKHLALR
jgi:hypothetical protein